METDLAIAVEPESLNAQLASFETTLKALASRCDAMCLTAGIKLGNAVPSLYDLSNRFSSLSSMLINEDGSKPVRTLERVARDIMTIGTALSIERDSVESLIAINRILSQRIIGLAEHVRFLSAVVSNVKIEIATIEGEHRLEGFADNLKQLASKSEATVSSFQQTHRILIRQLQRTAHAQSNFVSSHGAKFKIASEEITASLGVVSSRRAATSGIAAEIGAITQQIGAKIAQCVVALQIGDSTRQRLEHAGEGLTLVADFIADPDSGGVEHAAGVDDKADWLDRIAARVCSLEAAQTTRAGEEFSAEIETIANLIAQITDASTTLNEKSWALIAAPKDGSRSFLADLEAKLASAGDLIDECGKSRKLVDDTAEKVIASVTDLHRLAENVAAMATDMMIIGTNAVVTSYRLGTKGIPLSVIAQHLRSHAVHVTDAVKLVSPALDKVRDAAKQFALAREGQDASSMSGLTDRISEALAAFQAGDSAVAEVHQRLDAEVSTVSGVLRQAADALDDADAIEIELKAVTQTIEAVLADAAPLDAEEDLPPSLDKRLRATYTMGSERSIHDGFTLQGSPPPSIPSNAADLSCFML